VSSCIRAQTALGTKAGSKRAHPVIFPVNANGTSSLKHAGMGSMCHAHAEAAAFNQDPEV
jgi:hypothetical protein